MRSTLGLEAVPVIETRLKAYVPQRSERIERVKTERRPICFRQAFRQDEQAVEQVRAAQAKRELKVGVPQRDSGELRYIDRYERPCRNASFLVSFSDICPEPVSSW